jgi:hypothetical protein
MRALFALAACLAGCSHTTAPPPVSVPTAPALAQASVPGFFADIPADTPYLFGSFDPAPVDFYKVGFRRLGPVLKKAVEQARRTATDPDAFTPRFLAALSVELDGKVDFAGIESLGLAARPRFAVYGLGLLPIVARFEIKDATTLTATIERVASHAGLSLGPRTPRGDRWFWRFTVDKNEAILSVARDEMIAAFGPTETIEDNLDLILGITRPPHSMADGGALAQVIKEHRFSRYGAGYLDTRLALRLGTAMSKQHPTEACSGELERLAASVPRIAFGYYDLTAKHMSMGIAIDMSSELLEELRGLEVSVPGLEAAMASPSLIAFGGGLDFSAGQRFAVGALASWHQAWQACVPDESDHDLVEAIDAVSRPLPAVLQNITGAALAVEDVTFKFGSRTPDTIDGALAVTAADPKALYDLLVANAPNAAALGITPDGQLHDIPTPPSVPYRVAAGIGPNALVLSLGDAGRDLAARVIAAPRDARAPLATISYDFPRLVAVLSQLGPSGLTAADLELTKDLQRLGATLEVTDRALVLTVWTDSI